MPSKKGSAADEPLGKHSIDCPPLPTPGVAALVTLLALTAPVLADAALVEEPEPEADRLSVPLRAIAPLAVEPPLLEPVVAARLPAAVVPPVIAGPVVAPVVIPSIAAPLPRLPAVPPPPPAVPPVVVPPAAAPLAPPEVEPWSEDAAAEGTIVVLVRVVPDVAAADGPDVAPLVD